MALESGEVSPFGHDPDLASAPAGEALLAWVREALGGELLERLYALWLRFEGGESKVEWKYLLQARTGGVALWSRAFPYDREDHYRVEGEELLRADEAYCLNPTCDRVAIHTS